MIRPIYLIYGLLAMGLGTTGAYRGWTLFPPKEVHGVPKSIRDNPGAYRSIYTGYSRYTGGK